MTHRGGLQESGGQVSQVEGQDVVLLDPFQHTDSRLGEDQPEAGAQHGQPHQDEVDEGEEEHQANTKPQHWIIPDFLNN